RDERVAEPLAEIHGAAIDGVEHDAIPPSERRGADADVDDEVEHGAAGDRHVLRLARRYVGEMDAAHHPATGDGCIRLLEIERMPDGLREGVEPVPLPEGASVVAELPGFDLPGARDRELRDQHARSLTTPARELPGARFPGAPRIPPGRLPPVRILVTGGAGFIGSNFVRPTLQDAYPGLEGAEVVVYDALTYSGNLANLAPVADSPRYSFVHGDIRDADLLDRTLPGIDAVVHFAAESHVDRSVRDAGPFVETNVVGTQRLLDASLRAGIQRFVHVSTDEEYGSIDEGSWDEAHPLEPNSPYSASKAGSDLLARAFHRTHGMNVSITRCSNNYGPYHFPEKVIPLFVTNLIDGLHVPLYGDGRNVRDWLHVDDHCRGVALVLTSGRADRKSTRLNSSH